MATTENIKLGVCTLKFNGLDLGYTQGGIKVTYKADVVEKIVDQEDAAVGSSIKNQSFEVEVPLAEYDLERLVSLFPGASLITDESSNKRVMMSGKAGIDLQASAAPLVIIPIGGDVNDTITIHSAIPDTQIDFSFNKDSIRVYKIVFRAIAGASGFVSFGDPNAASAPSENLLPQSTVEFSNII